MKTLKYERVHVPFFCEGCGKESFEGVAFGREISRLITASSGDRAMWCEGCRPAPKVYKMPVCQLSSFFTRPEE